MFKQTCGLKALLLIVEWQQLSVENTEVLGGVELDVPFARAALDSYVAYS